MKKLQLLLPAVLLLSACSNDFDVTAPWKEIPVVYGILAPLDVSLSPKDTAYYVRIEKAFLDPERGALEIAQIADSLYYPENAISVWLERKGFPQTRIQLTRVDGALEGYPRESGIFAGQPNWLYKAKPSGNFVVEAGKTYRLMIERKDGKPSVTAETTLPADFFVTKPDLTPIIPRIAFTSNLPGTPIEWRSDVNGYFFNITFKVRYVERNPNGTVFSSHELVWEAAKNATRDSLPSGGGFYRANVSIPRNSFYGFLAKNMQKPQGNRYREFVNCDLIIDGGGREIKEYLDTYRANSGLTGAESFPNYTNISEGYGIFSSKNRLVVPGLRIDVATVDTMNRTSIADTLGFRY